MKNVVISGMGAMSSLGLNIDDFWKNCLDGNSVCDEIPDSWHQFTDFSSGIWSPLPPIDYQEHGFNRVELAQYDKVTLLAMAATKQALQAANIELAETENNKRQFKLTNLDSNRVGVIIGTGIGGVSTLLENHSHLVLNKLEGILIGRGLANPIANYTKPRRLNPFTVSMTMPNAVAAAVGIKYSINGINNTISQACASGTSAIGAAYKAIQSGEIDIAICGGAEYMRDEYGAVYKSFDIARTLAIPKNDIQTANCPFDKDHSGFLFSEGGAGILVLESQESALARGAHIVAKIIGASESFDAHSMMSLAPEGLQIKRMLNNLLSQTNLTSRDINYVNAHGTGTKLNDSIESTLIKEFFPHAPYVNSTKSILGHTIGASGAFEAIASALSLQHQLLHPNLNLNNPMTDINLVGRKSLAAPLNYALSQSFAFGGHNCGIILEKY